MLLLPLEIKYHIGKSTVKNLSAINIRQQGKFPSLFTNGYFTDKVQHVIQIKSYLYPLF